MVFFKKLQFHKQEVLPEFFGYFYFWINRNIMKSKTTVKLMSSFHEF